jgi:putative membrane protein
MAGVLEFLTVQLYLSAVAESHKSAPVLSASSSTAAMPHPLLSATAARWHKPVFVAFLVVWLVNAVLLWLRIELPPGARWIEALFPLLAVATTLLALGRRLPLQNVITAACVIGSISTGIVTVGVATGFPFGPIVFGDSLGEKLFQVVPWAIPLLWVVLIINGRGVARLMMRPWRKTNFYGFWVMGLTCLLVVCFDLGLEPFAVQAKGYWVWPLGRAVASWYTAPWANFLAWFITALAILTFTIPWLINKQPIKQPMDYHPLIVWFLLNLWIASGNALHQLWLAVAVTIVSSAVAIVFATRGAHW